MKNSKIVYVLLDGIGDLPHPDLNELTPLEASLTPNLDKIARNGIMGEVISVGEGIAPQSDIAVFNMLGYDFKNNDYVGRGVVECIGSNIDFRQGDLALRGNFATIDSNKKILDRRAGRNITKNEAETICNLITKEISIDDVIFSIKPTIGHRVIIRFRHQNESLGEGITNTDPAYDKINGIGIAKSIDNDKLFVNPSKPLNKNSEISSHIVNEFSDNVIKLLKDCETNDMRIKNGLLPINCILLRDAGNRVPNVQHINEKFGLNTASLVDMPVEIGISNILKMIAYDAGTTNQYELKAKKLIEIIDKHDLVYVHIKGPDEFGHDGDAKGKKKSIEEIDAKFFKQILQGLGYLKNLDINFIICGDHSTPCIKKAHTDDPIPLLISGKTIKNDGSSRFTENYAKKGQLGRIKGSKVIEIALKNLRNNNYNK